MSGKHRWRRNRGPSPSIRIPDFRPTMPSHFNQDTQKLEFIGPTPEENVKLGFSSTLFGIPVVIINK